MVEARVRQFASLPAAKIVVADNVRAVGVPAGTVRRKDETPSREITEYEQPYKRNLISINSLLAAIS